MEKEEDTEFEYLPKEDLCQLLRRFYGELLAKDGRSYSRSSILGIRAAIQRHLTGPCYKRVINIVTGPEFRAANEVIIGKLRELKKKGFDTSKAHPPIADEDLKKIYSSNALNNDDLTGLQLKVFFEMSFQFG